MKGRDMKREFSLLICAALVLAVMTGLSPAQGPGKGEAPMGWPMGRMYDVKSVEIVKGEVVAVDVAASGRMDIPGRVMLSVKTKTETVTAYLGPEWYVKEQGLKLAVGDQVEVKGSRVVMEGKPMLIANYVKKGDRTLNLRDDQGMPFWARGRGRQP